MFRGMSGEHVTLELLGKQLERVISEQNSTRDDLRVLTTIVLRLEGTLNGVLDQLHAMVSQYQRFDARLRRSRKSERHESVPITGQSSVKSARHPLSRRPF
jgi:hypothetical protein